jgi:glutamate racemase
MTIGVFDSGVGGLTVLQALRRRMPHRDFVYLGDTARVPYGTRGASTVIKYASGCGKQLVLRGVKALVIACNTVSAVAPERLRIDLDLPVLEAIGPGARAAVNASKTGKIGVLATAGTIASGAYTRAIGALDTRAEVFGQAAPLLVPLAEEGWTDGDVPRLAARKYLEPLARANVDVVVLGCTHYPILRGVIEQAAKDLLGSHVVVVDSASAIAESVGEFLRARGLTRESTDRGSIKLLVTDAPKSFEEVAGRFLGDVVQNVELIDL